MRLLLSFLLLFFTTGSYAQQDTSYVVVPEAFYTDAQQPLLHWKGDLPATFEFSLFNRWGESLFTEKKNPHFILKNTSKQKWEAPSVFFLQLKVTMPDKTTFEIRKQINYLGFYCGG